MTAHLTGKARRDCALITEALQNGSQKAYADLMEYYRNPLYHMILKMVKNPDDAEDLTLEAFAKAFRNLDNYKETFAFSTWLFRIAMNNCIDFIRRENSSPRHMVDITCDDELSLSDPADTPQWPTPEELVIEKQKMKMMRLAVAQLRPKYKKVVELRYFDECSYEEIAAELEISIHNVKVLLFRAKDMLASIAAPIKNAI